MADLSPYNFALEIGRLKTSNVTGFRGELLLGPTFFFPSQPNTDWSNLEKPKSHMLLMLSKSLLAYKPNILTTHKGCLAGCNSVWEGGRIKDGPTW